MQSSGTLVTFEGKMHIRLSLKDLLLAGVPCSSSSFLSTSQTNPSRGIGSSVRKTLNASHSIDHHATRSDSAEKGVNVLENCRKRKGKAPHVIRELKKLKVESTVLTVFKDSWLLVGRLLLWNRTASSHSSTGSNSLDCLAFCDGAIAVCCTVRSLDVELLGQHVQVNSWTFVPATQHSDEQCNADDGSAGSHEVPRLNRTGCYIKSKSPECSGNVGVLPQLSDCGGCLEIHSLKLLAEPCLLTAQVSDFPSLCLSPAAANIRNLVLESPLEKNGTHKPRLRVRGFLHCISPPFMLPSKSSQNAASIADGRSLLGQGPQKSLFKDKSGSRVLLDSQSMLGFLVELRPCCHGTSCQPKYNKNVQGTCLDQKIVDACEDGAVAIYFSGAVASWRPLLGGMLGDCIAISGLRRKMIRLGPEKKEFYIYVATRTSLVLRIGPPLVNSKLEKEGAIGFCKHIISNQLLNQTGDQSRRLRRFDGSYEMARSTCLRHQVQVRIKPSNEASEKAGLGLQSYVGKITSILMHDQLLELDDKVWLLLTHYKHTQVHGLRVGAMVAIRHAHFMTLKSVSEKVLVLGACLRSSVWVVIHSVSNAGSRISQTSQSRLIKYIGSLPFALAFWVLQVIISLGCKLQGVYTKKELLGSSKHAGLILKVLPSMMAAPVTLHRDAFMEFLSHQQFCSLEDTSASISLSKVPPLSNFCKHVELLWFDPMSSFWCQVHIRNDGNGEPGAKTVRLCTPVISQTLCYVRHIISSSKLGVVLLGSLKVCQSSGKLQLVDATGALDAVVPDFRSLSSLHCVYQITEYKLVMEGDHKAPDLSAAGKDSTKHSPLSWSSLLKGSVLENRAPQSLSYYVQFHLRNAKILEGLTWPSECQGHQSLAAVDLLSTNDLKNDSAGIWKGKEFNIALITHKYPARRKYSAVKENQWAFDMEVVFLPYNLLIHQDNDACSDTLNSPWQSFDFNASRVEGAIKISDHVGALQCHKPEELGSNKAYAQGSLLSHSGCIIECCACCLVEQPSGLNKSAGQPCTLAASLVSRGCSARTTISGSYCATKEEHWAKLSETKLQKVVLAVNWRSIEISQLFNTGDWCLLPILQGNLSSIKSSELNLAFERVETGAKQPLISLQWRHAPNCQVDAKPLEQITSSSKRSTSTCIPHDPSKSSIMDLTECGTESEDSTLKINKSGCSDCDTEVMSEGPGSRQPQLVDTVLTVTNALGDAFKQWLASLKSKLIPQTLSVSEALQLTPHPTTILSNSGSNLEDTRDVLSADKLGASSGIFSLQGDVVSIQGKLETTECSDDHILINDGDPTDSTCLRFSGCTMRQSHFQLRDLRTDQRIGIQINFDKYVRPVGFGPGVVACFQKILLGRDANLLVSMPTTNVLIESVENRHHNLPLKNQQLSTNSLPPQEQEDFAEDVTDVDLLNDFVCELEPRKKYLRIHCRVVSVQELELEWQIARPLSERIWSTDMLSVEDDMIRDIAVKRACFILDDGSAVAVCWASGEQAAKLLGFHGSARDTSAMCPIIAIAQNSSLQSEQESAQGPSFSRVLRSLVRRHKRIYVQGESPQGDTGTTAWLIKGVDDDLEENEFMILRLFLKQACQQGPKVVHCTTTSEKDNISRYAEECHQRQILSSASGMSISGPWQALTWNRTQLLATKVDVLNTSLELQHLASAFNL